MFFPQTPVLFLSSLGLGGIELEYFMDVDVLINQQASQKIFGEKEIHIIFIFPSFPLEISIVEQKDENFRLGLL